MNAARGCLLGVLLGTVLWSMILFLLYQLFF